MAKVNMPATAKPKKTALNFWVEMSNREAIYPDTITDKYTRNPMKEKSKISM